MKIRAVSHLFVLKIIILAITVIYFLGVGGIWLNDPELSLHKEMYLSTMLLIAAACVVLNKTWSNLLAAILCGQLPVRIFYEFWMFAKNAEIPIFGSSHFYMGLTDLINMEWQPLLWCALAIIMLSFSVSSISRAAVGGRLP